MEYITSRNNKRIINLLSLYEEENIIKNKLFINEGLINLKEALRWGEVKEIYALKKYEDDIKDIDALKFIVSEEVMKKISKLKNPSGIVFTSVLKDMDISEAKKIIYLDDVQDPGNVGTIIRTALAFNYDLVVLSPFSASLFNSKVLSSSRGSIYKLPLIKEDFLSLKDKFKEHEIISTTLDDNSIDLNDIEVKDKFILVFGNEGHGIKKEIIQASHKLVKIEMNEIDSLNVALSMGIISYVLKNRK